MKCKLCGDKFKGRLPWQDFCCPDHQSTWRAVQNKLIYRMGKNAVTDDMIRADIRGKKKAVGRAKKRKKNSVNS